MKKILMLGAGRIAKPMADYLLKNGFQLTIASRTVSKAERLIENNKNGTAVGWTTDKIEKLEELVSSHDLTLSLLPYAFHIDVAGICIKQKKHLITTSYVSEKMKALDSEAKKAGILILNEIGLDPGLDHMTAMRIINNVHENGGKIKKFYSICGALPAPEEADNPFRYKFSWSPQGILMAVNKGAKFLKDKETIQVSSDELFKNPLHTEFPNLGNMEVYPNRDSLQYINFYGLPETETIYRGTFRYPHWCEIMDAVKALGMMNYEIQNFENKSYKEIVAEQLNVYPRNVKEKVAERLQLELGSPAIEAMEWLGYFDKELVKLKSGSTFDITSHLMQNKMMLQEGARDMVIMQHSILIENPDGTEEVINAYLQEFGEKENTAIARTVALPAAIAAKLILENHINEKGVQIPVKKAIYEPVLHELNAIGISMKEQVELPLWEMPE